MRLSMSYALAEIVDLQAYRVTQRPKQDHAYEPMALSLPAPYWLWMPVFTAPMRLFAVADINGRD